MALYKVKNITNDRSLSVVLRVNPVAKTIIHPGKEKILEILDSGTQKLIDNGQAELVETLPGGTNAGHSTEDEGGFIGEAIVMDFVGDGVTVTEPTPGNQEVNIPGAAGDIASHDTNAAAHSTEFGAKAAKAAVVAAADAGSIAEGDSTAVAASDASTVGAADATAPTAAYVQVDTATISDLANANKAEINTLVTLANANKAEINGIVLLVNETKADYNAAVTLINELKAKMDAMNA